MTRDELAQALDAYRDGEIAPADAARLAEVIRERGEDSRWALEEIETAGLIAQALDDTDSEAFVRGFWERVRAEEGSDVFVHDFEEKYEGAFDSSARKVLPFAPAHRWWIAAAAAVVLLAAGASFWMRPHDAAMARVEQVQGDVVIVGHGAGKGVRSGERLFSGDGLRITGEESSATVVFADGTRLEVGADTIITSLTNDPAGGKRVVLGEGFLTAQVVKQPAGRPMILTTPQSEVVVLGTSFSLSIGTAVTYLETQSGKVRLNRKSDGRSVEVPAGFDAIVAGGGGPLVAQPLVPRSATPRLQLEGYWAATLSPKDHTLAASRYLKGDVEIWDAHAGQRQSAFRAHAKRVTTTAFSPDGSTLATGSLDGTAKVWDRASGRLQATLSPGFGAVIDLAFHSDGQALAVLSLEEKSEKRTITSWDLSTRTRRWAAQQFWADHWVLSPDGKLLAASRRQDRTLTLWDLNSGAVKTVFTGEQNEFTGILRNVFSMAFSHDGRTLAVDGSSGLVTLWDVPTSRIRTTFQRPGGRIFGMTFSPDDRVLATGHQDGTIRLWEIATAKPLAAFAGHSRAHARAVEFASDGRSLLTREIRLATAATRRDGVLLLWDLPASITSPKPNHQ